jgi:leucyl-tRNA synthetase
MSKSRGNVIAPDEYVKAVGSDVVRTYLMFIGPWDQGGEWNDSGINGAARWLNRIWDLVTEGVDGYLEGSQGSQVEKDLDRVLHQTIRKVTNDTDIFKYNTAISSLMEFTNYLCDFGERQKDQWNVPVSRQKWKLVIETLLILVSPIAPHITEELWQVIGNEFSIHKQVWPKYDEEIARNAVITLVVQINGKVRDKIIAPADINEDRAKELALSSNRVKENISGKEILKVILVPGRLINLVVQ